MEARQGGDGLPAPFTTAPVPVREVARSHGQRPRPATGKFEKMIQTTATIIRSVHSSVEIHSRVLQSVRGIKKSSYAAGIIALFTFLSSRWRILCYPAPATHRDITDSGAGFPASTTSDASSDLPGQGSGRFQRSE